MKLALKTELLRDPERDGKPGLPQCRLNFAATDGARHGALANMESGASRWPRRIPANRHAFTLIELILVLALLTIVTSLAAPSLSRFFRGRTLNSEARQLLSLTHAAQSRAVSEGFPVLVWIDPQQRVYGIQLEFSSQQGNAQDVDPKAEEFAFDGTLQVDAPDAAPVTVNGRSVAAIRFLPDGTADPESPARLRIVSQNGDVLWLIESTNRLSYEIRNSDK